MSLLYFLSIAFVAIASTPVHVNALKPSEALVLVQDTQQYDVYGLFSTQFVGIELDENGWGFVYFQCGDWADASYVLTTETKFQTVPFFMSDFVSTYGTPSTHWIYLSMAGTIGNVDWIQIRIVAHGHQGPITPLFDKPPRAWRYGYPPYGTISPMIQGTDTETSALAPADGTAVALPSPTIITMPPRRQSSTSSIAVWLAPLLVGIIMIAITIPIAIVAYKKGKNNAKVAEVEVQVQAQDQQQQQQQQETNQVQVACV